MFELSYTKPSSFRTANMFLVNEHVTCETLETVIDPKQHQRESIFIDPIISHDSMLRSYVMDVLEGVEFIQSYGVSCLNIDC